MSLENVTYHKVSLLLDGYVQTSTILLTLTPLIDDVETLKTDVGIIQKAVTAYSGKLQKLEQAN